jgi:polysaccharide export outer membrane protein
MKLFEFGTEPFWARIFSFVLRAGSANNGSSMRNHSSVCSTCLRIAMLGLAMASVLALRSPALHAQCSDGDDPDSLACQIQEPVESTTPAPDSPAVLSLSETEQKQPRADRSTEASASGSLPGGSTYTERAPRENRGKGRARAEMPPPEPPTEFQRFVAATTGEMLPIYGASLFAGHAVSFAPISYAPAPEDLIVSAGDELLIRIWGQVNFSANLRVDREGEIYLPKVGAVHVAGLPFSQVQDHLRRALERVYRNFELSVDLGEIHAIQVYVTGQARQPGEYTVSALSTLVDAVFASGGPSAAGSMRHIELKRGGRVVTDFDLYALLVKGDKTGDMQLQPGDVLYIPPAGPQVAVLGSVREPGIYELRGDEPLGHLLNAAGGRTAMALGAHLSVERIADHAGRRVFELAANREGLNTRLADGDIVRVEPIVSNYRDTVTLRGSVANPGRFRWHQDMRLSELIPDRDSLVTRGYWWRRTQLGLPAPEFVDPSDETPAGGLSRAGAQMASSGFAGHGMETGEDNADTDRPVKPAAVLSPGAQTDWNYAVIERLDPATMTTSLIPFDLGKLVLEHDASQDRELQAGDVVTIFSQDDVRPPVERQTKYVQLDGEVVNAGIYSAAPGETLRSLVARAGGLTPQAYLYGAEFTRKSTQLLEQERLNEYTDRLEQLMERNSIALAGALGGDTLQNPAASVNRALVARLRQLRAAGRIVLDLSPQSKSVDDLPELPLEDGDRFVIPSTPSTVQVIGSVFNQNAFLYRRGARVGEYLRMAGGPTREADRGQMFVLRADGSVASRDARQSVFAPSGFDDLRLYPGDTIVVPEKMVRPSSLRELMNWTQLMSQFSLSAAAVDVIK